MPSMPAKLINPKGDRDRPSAYDRGYNRRWRKVRLTHLKREPICRVCKALGIINDKNLDVDHIVPHRNDYERMWDMGNLQTLCKVHHSEKTGSGL